MTILSNLYVEKADSEHPLSIWMLNEDIDYISHITEENRLFEDPAQWNLLNCTATNEIAPYNTPIKNTNVSRISGNTPSGPTIDIEASSVYFFFPSDFNQDEGNFAISFYLYVDNPYANSISYGYKYINGTTMLPDELVFTENLSASDAGSWKFFTHTFSIPESYVSDTQILIRINAVAGGGVGDYDFLINGLTLGQWSEDFNLSSLGQSVEPLLSNIPLPSELSTIKAFGYGNNKNAYYLASNHKLFCKNFGIPLVFGSTNVTKLYPNKIDDVVYPSLIFPGYGFLNERGKYNEYTAEIWLRINTDSIYPRRIFGPITSSDGLYVEGGFLTLVIGKKYSAHYVGEWYRPMLIHIRYIKNNISVLLNGEEVISIDYLESEIDFPSEFAGLDNQDWLGFYAYDDVHPISIDSFAIYSYSVPNEVAKRKWVWGQGITAPEVTNSSLNATTALSDYSFANYAVNYNYPDFAQWKQAFFSNLNISSSFISFPNYTLPQIFIGNVSEENWYEALKLEQIGIEEKYYSFRPSIPSSQQCYAHFNNLNILNEPIQSFYAVFESDGTSVNETLIKIVNSYTKDYLAIKLDGTDLIYEISLDYAGEYPTTLFTKTIVENQKFTVGINIPTFSLLEIPGIEKFFSNLSLLSMYLYGDGETTFSGKTYRVGFDAAYNNRKIKNLYSAEGIFNENLETATTLMSHIANYTIKPYEKYENFFIDIAVSGYWEDYMPLSYFSKAVTGYDQKTYYDLDSLQINFDYPEPLETSAVETISSWTYADIFTRYSSPIEQTYSDLSNSVYSGWEDYQDLSEDSDKYFYYNTAKSNVKCYVSFQKILDGANKNLADYQYKAVARVKGVVDPNLLTDYDPDLGVLTPYWEDKAFEIVDGSIVYPPLTNKSGKNIDFNDLAIVYHLDFVSEGINHHPLKFREFQIASQVLKRHSFTEIGTKLGVPVYPYRKIGFYYDFKGKNPMAVYKGSTPHLYTNRHSGWRVKGDLSAIVERGISLPINAQKGLGTEVSAVQIWGRFSDKQFPQAENKIFSIDHKDGTYDFYVIADESTQRGKILAKDSKTNAIITNVEYYINGKHVKDAYIVNEEWFVLGLAFPSLISFDQYTGRINLNGLMTYNNISYYLATNLEQKQRVETRSWSSIKNFSWDYWQNSFNWSNFKIVNTYNFYSINPGNIYEKYVGANRIIVDDGIDGILLQTEKMKVYSDVSWSTTTKIPV